VDSADVVLMSGSLTGICRAVELSKATIRNIRQNLFWAFFYNSLGIPVAFSGLLSPMIGSAAMSLSSVFVVTNALRLRLFQPKCQGNCENIPENAEILEVEEEKIMETIIKVEGMMCKHCKAMVEKVCKAVPGTVDAVVDLEKKQVTVYGSADVAALKKAIVDADYQVIE
jgi:Cu+-exporting ATPase